MQILYYVSLILFLHIAYTGFRVFLKVRDNDLGHEEIILFSVGIISALNIGINVIKLFSEYAVPVLVIHAYLAFGVTLFQALLSYTIIKYIDSAYKLRLDSKGRY